MQIINELKLDFDDVLIRPKRSEMGSRSQVNILRKFKTLSGQDWEGIPIMASNFDTVGTFAMAKALSHYGMITCLHKFYAKEDLIEFFNIQSNPLLTFYTLGVGDEDIAKLKFVVERTEGRIKNILVDIANGYTKYFSDKVRQVRNLCPNAILMAGNVATPEMVQELIISGGVDIVKVGIGPGSVCETRIVAGVGYPQLSAIIECSDAAHGLDGLICADGGCKTPGDVVKAFGAGADFVMLGGMLSGTDPCDGEWQFVEKSGTIEKISLKFYGMSSREAMEKHNGGIANYRASEGSCIQIPYKGPVENVVQQILGGLRSACAYVGASKLKDLSKCTTFIRVNRIK